MRGFFFSVVTRIPLRNRLDIRVSFGFAAEDTRMARERIIDLVPEEDDQKDDAYVDPIDTLLNAFDAGEGNERITARVFRLDGSSRSGAEQPFLFAITPEEAEGVNERLRDTYGTGKYLVRVLRNGKFFKQITYHVEAPAPPAAPKQSDVAEIVKAIQANNDAMWQRMEATLAQRTQAPVIDPMSMLEKMTTVMTNMRGLMPAQHGGQQNNAPNMEAVFGLVERGMELGKQIAGGDQEDASILGMVKSVVLEVVKQPQFGDMMGSFLQRVTPSAPALTPPTEQPPNVQQPSPAQVAFTNVLNYLSAKAALNKDVGLYVDWFLDDTDPQLVQQFINTPNLLDQLCSVHPGVAQNRAWFSKFIDVLKEPAQGGAPEVPTDEPSGDGQHTDDTNVATGDAGR